MKRSSFIAAALAVIAIQAQAAEGLWTFDKAPIDKIRAETGAVINQAWLDHLRLSAVRLSSGCSASVVSGEGLVATNNHCVEDCEADLSSGRNDYVKNGFYTSRREDERLCPGMDAEILIGITDITDQVRSATAGKEGRSYVDARDQALNAAERAACGEDHKFRCEALSFFGGGQFRLHRYRRYADVRLVFAPEQEIGFFGGDPDNFNFPRYDLDISFVRLYEEGRLVMTPTHLTWSLTAPAAGDAVFTAGNPGSSFRNMTMAQLNDERDYFLRVSNIQRAEFRGRVIEYATKGTNQKRAAISRLFGVENSAKRDYGRQLALSDPAFLAVKQAQEDELRAGVRANPQLAARIGDPWADIATAQRSLRERTLTYRQLEASAGGGSDLFGYARTAVRGARERAKPEAERLPAFSPSRLPNLERNLLDPFPYDPGLERMTLEFWLLKTREYLTVDHPAVKTILGSESPERLAHRLVTTTKLGDPDERRRLWAGGVAAINASSDPMIVFLRKIDELGVAEPRAWTAQVSGPIERAQARIADARFAIYGQSVYPDANFTLRLSYGKVEGWTYNGQTVAPTTNFAGLYQRATGQFPFALPPKWIAAKDKLNPDTVLNFSTSNDILGGNSGSPTVNARGEIVGLAFDGNILSLGGQYGFDAAVNRSVIVSTVAITEALEKVYGQQRLAAELTGR